MTREAFSVRVEKRWLVEGDEEVFAGMTLTDWGLKAAELGWITLTCFLLSCLKYIK